MRSWSLNGALLLLLLAMGGCGRQDNALPGWAIGMWQGKIMEEHTPPESGLLLFLTESERERRIVWTFRKCELKVVVDSTTDRRIFIHTEASQGEFSCGEVGVGNLVLDRIDSAGPARIGVEYHPAGKPELWHALLTKQ